MNIIENSFMQQSVKSRSVWGNAVSAVGKKSKKSSEHPKKIFSFGFGSFFGINLANKALKALYDALTIFVHPLIVDSLALKVNTR